MQYNDTYFTRQETVVLPVDYDRTVHVINCDEGSENEMADCMNAYNYGMQNRDAKMYYDLMFLVDGVFNAIEKTEIR